MEYMSYAQSVGEEQIPDGYVFFPGDFDTDAGDYDPEETKEVIQLVADNDQSARERALGERIRFLESMLQEYRDGNE